MRELLYFFINSHIFIALKHLNWGKIVEPDRVTPVDHLFATARTTSLTCMELSLGEQAAHKHLHLASTRKENHEISKLINSFNDTKSFTYVLRKITKRFLDSQVYQYIISTRNTTCERGHIIWNHWKYDLSKLGISLIK